MAEPAGVEVELAHATLQVNVERLARLVERVQAGEGVRAGTVSIVLADHETVLDLNRTYLAHDYLTDVLSFNLGDPAAPDVIEGEVYVDLDTALERHQEFGTTFEEEVRRYVVHGVLHLIGYDDGTPEEKASMHALEDRYLAGQG